MNFANLEATASDSMRQIFPVVVFRVYSGSAGNTSRRKTREEGICERNGGGFDAGAVATGLWRSIRGGLHDGAAAFEWE